MSTIQQYGSFPTLYDIQQAYSRLLPFINRTPILKSATINEMIGAEVFFKCENFQKTGSFKMRGAVSSVFSLTEDEVKNGICTHSSGNHAQAIAYAAKLRNVPAYIVMPEGASKAKVEAVKAYGGQITFCNPTLPERQAAVDQVIKDTNACFFHPFNDYRIIAGQATIAKAFFRQVEGLDIIMTPIGGGGLASGTALATHYLSKHTRVIGVEPDAADDARRSVEAGQLIPLTEAPNTVADGLRTSLGDKTFEIIKELVTQVTSVSEESIIKAMRLIWERLKIIIEPSCAVPFAALLENKVEDIKGKKIGIILTGGNIDLDALPWVIK